jgi:hypothetical protein
MCRIKSNGRFTIIIIIIQFNWIVIITIIIITIIIITIIIIIIIHENKTHFCYEHITNTIRERLS